MSETLLERDPRDEARRATDLRERVRALAAQEPARAPFLARFEWRPEWKRLVLVAPATLIVALVAGGVIGLTRDDVVKRRSTRRPPVERVATTLDSYAQRDSRSRALRSARCTHAAGAAPPGTGDAGAAVAPAPGPAAALRGRAAPARRGRRGAFDRHEARAADRTAAQRQRRLAPVRRTRRGRRRRADHAPHPHRPSAERDVAALAARHDRRPALRDRGPAAAGRLPPDADRADPAPDRADPGPARELEPLRPRTASSSSRAWPIPAEADRPARGLRGTNAEARTATIYLTLTTEEIQPGAVGGSPLDDIKDVLAWEAIALLYVLVVAGPFVLLGILVWLALRLRRRQVETRLLEQN